MNLDLCLTLLWPTSVAFSPSRRCIFFLNIRRSSSFFDSLSAKEFNSSSFRTISFSSRVTVSCHFNRSSRLRSLALERSTCAWWRRDWRDSISVRSDFSMQSSFSLKLSRDSFVRSSFSRKEVSFSVFNSRASSICFSFVCVSRRVETSVSSCVWSSVTFDSVLRSFVLRFKRLSILLRRVSFSFSILEMLVSSSATVLCNVWHSLSWLSLSFWSVRFDVKSSALVDASTFCKCWRDCSAATRSSFTEFTLASFVEIKCLALSSFALRDSISACFSSLVESKLLEVRSNVFEVVPSRLFRFLPALKFCQLRFVLIHRARGTFLKFRESFRMFLIYLLCVR